MIISAATVRISYQDLENLFNSALEREIKEWENEKKEYFNDPFNNEGRVFFTGKYLSGANFQIWLKVPKNLVTAELINTLLKDIDEAGWNVEFKWQEDEHTGEDTMYFFIKKK